MNKRCLILACWLLTLGMVSHAVGNETDKKTTVKGYYQRIDPPFPTQAGEGRIEVLEFFLYACPHCNELEQKLPKWMEDKADEVVLRRIPAIVGQPWAEQARVFYTAESLGILDQAHGALFDSIHADNKHYGDEQSILEFFTRQGVTAEKFYAAYHSPEVADKVSQARVMTVKYGIQGVPAVIINGKYKTAQYFTGNQETMLEVMDMLFARARADNAQGAVTNR